ncbi:MAG: DUF3343 domain-containing protein [Tissierellia bacterium]|nr:DUF3343 domain-containing protein [Tissierellia bacterium]
MDKEFLVITFNSVNCAMQVEKKLLEDEVDIKTIPTPREISNSCGLAIMTSLDNYDYVLEKKEEGLNILHLWKYYKGKEIKKAELLN